MSTRTRRNRKCLVCTRPTETIAQVCRACQIGAYDDDTDIVLQGGAWVPTGRGTVKWVADQLPEPVAVKTEPPVIHELIACPTCHARVDQTCRTRSGHTTTPHLSRLAPRLCPCGARLDWRRRMCEPCSVESYRTSRRDSQRRIRAMQKEVAA